MACELCKRVVKARGSHICISLESVSHFLRTNARFLSRNKSHTTEFYTALIKTKEITAFLFHFHFIESDCFRVFGTRKLVFLWKQLYASDPKTKRTTFWNCWEFRQICLILLWLFCFYSTSYERSEDPNKIKHDKTRFNYVLFSVSAGT
jgi:hypothetical protein